MSPTLFSALLLLVVGIIMLASLAYAGLALVKIGVAIACFLCAGYFRWRHRRERRHDLPPVQDSPE